eukprot:TRINITY_DN4578_c0_g1_i1.p2 TRINITY_DN4578_c0_g1~~TRINITY_DN4578_c0_g1_i1.p2  ORF type:complete len:237 (+),score=58.31 TRINITY_DN4578_c0_g1_i1:59-712(+)
MLPSLGWLATSAALPQKPVAIEGISQGTMVQMKAELLTSSGGPRKPKNSKGGITNIIKNPGIESRIKRDLEETRKEKDTQGQAQAKAKLYDMLRSGSLKPDDLPGGYGGCLDIDAIAGTDDEPNSKKDRIWEGTELDMATLLSTNNEPANTPTEEAQNEIKALRERKRHRRDERLRVITARRKHRLEQAASSLKESILRETADDDLAANTSEKEEIE